MKFPKILSTLLLVLASCANTPAKNATAPDAATAATAATAHEDAATPLPVDPDVRVGHLDNGLTYYIRQHGQPDDRVNLWLAVNAGSVLEDDDQKGLAHFVEHMAFNGTKRFEKNTLIDFIERAGMDFGADVNAFTSFDETVYMLQVPTDDGKLVATGLDVLEDWSSAVSFDPQEVDKERGVVIEEWRLGRGAQQRVFDKQWPIYLAGSKYADRKPIGDRDTLRNAPVATLERFYEDWYRPDNMAVIIVGDIDPDAMEKAIKARFGGLNNPEKPRVRENVPVPLVDQTRAAVVTDPEASMSTVNLAIKGEYTKLETEGDYRDELIENLFHGMLRSRLSEISTEPESPFAFAFSYTNSMGRAVDTFNLTAGVKPGQIENTVETLLVEVERVRRHGFLASEFERQKKELLRRYERGVAEKDKVESRRLAFEAVNHFLEGEAMPGVDAELALVQKYLPTITLGEVNSTANTWAARKDRVVMASGAERDDMPGEKDILAVVDSIDAMNIDPYTEDAMGATLMAEAPKPGNIAKKETIAELGVTVLTLGNGARVIVKPTDFKNDEVLFQAFSPGGSSLVPDATYLSGEHAADVVSEGGLGEYDTTTIGKMLAGKRASVSPWVGELEEGLRGYASPQDLETLMQLTHLTFTAPRKDAEAFEAWKGQMSAFLKNRDLNPQSVFFEKLLAFSHDDHVRRQPLTMERLEDIDLEAAYDIYRDRFGDAGDFTFLFVGNVDESEIEALSETYLASLPTAGRKESWKDVGARQVKGVKKFELEKGQDPKSYVFMTFHGKADWSPTAQDDIELLAEVMDIRLREVLREELSGVYGAFSRGDIERRPREEYSYMIGFGCGPENVDKLKAAVFQIATEIKKSGVGEDYLAKVKEQRRRRLETDMKENRFWMRELSEHYRYGTDPKTILDLEKSVERVNNTNLKRAAKRYLSERQYIDGTLMPAPGVAEADANRTAG